MQCVELNEDGYICAKLIDFGISKSEVKDNVLVVPTSVYRAYGYFSPEAKKRNVELNPLKTDVFSFGLLCCDIIIQKKFKRNNIKSLWN